VTFERRRILMAKQPQEWTKTHYCILAFVDLIICTLLFIRALKGFRIFPSIEFWLFEPIMALAGVLLFGGFLWKFLKTPQDP
jgi:hypothetical protein